jgi:hypothetical protein
VVEFSSDKQKVIGLNPQAGVAESPFPRVPWYTDERERKPRKAPASRIILQNFAHTAC